MTWRCPKSFDELKWLAAERTEAHKNQSSQRVWSKGHDLVGLIGEVTFGEYFGIPADLSVTKFGDGGWDFIVNLSNRCYLLDVKTARNPIWLIHPEGKPFRSHIFVLARYTEGQERAELIGWETFKVLHLAEVREIKRKDQESGTMCHAIPANELRSMADLLKLKVVPPSQGKVL